MKRKFDMIPFNVETGKVCLLLIASVALFYFWEFPFHPIANIASKSILILIFYVLVILKLNVSEDISVLIKKYLHL